MRSYWHFYFTVVAHGLDRFGNFSHYTYPTIPLYAHGFAFYSSRARPSLIQSISPLLSPPFNLLCYFYFPSLALCTRPFHTVPCQMFKRSLSHLTYTPLYPLYICVARSHILSSNFWLSFAVSSHGVYFCRALLHEITPRAELYSIKLLGNVSITFRNFLQSSHIKIFYCTKRISY